MTSQCGCNEKALASSSASKKRKFDATSFDGAPQKRHSAAELFKPTMVTVVVSNSDIVEQGEAPSKEEFDVPRGLLCAHSSYFESAFQREFLESKKKLLRINDVDPRIFRIFVGWLFFQTVFYDADRKDRETEKDHESDHEDLDSSILSQSQRRYKQHRLDCSSTDPHDPLTWGFSTLLKIYVFTDKYDVRGLRLKIFDYIQFRVVSYDGVPSVRQVNYLVDNLPPNSNLIRLLVPYYPHSSASSLEGKKYEKLATYPPSFLAAIFRQSMRRQAARSCDICRQGETRVEHAKDHHPTDWNADMKAPCDYHEHGDDHKEAAQCAARWEERLATIEKVSAAAKAAAQQANSAA